MDPRKPPDLPGGMGVHWPGRGRGSPLTEFAAGRSRGLLVSTEPPAVGRARAFPTSAENVLGQGVALPTAEPVVGRARGLLVQPNVGVGRARGLLVPAAEPKVGLARGVGIPRVDPQQGPTPPSETVTPTPTRETPTLTKEEVRNRNVL